MEEQRQRANHHRHADSNGVEQQQTQPQSLEGRGHIKARTRASALMGQELSPSESSTHVSSHPPLTRIRPSRNEVRRLTGYACASALLGVPSLAAWAAPALDTVRVAAASRGDESEPSVYIILIAFCCQAASAYVGVVVQFGYGLS